MFGQVVFAQPLDQQVVIVDALAAADDFAIAFRREHVEGESQIGTLGVGLHVKCFDRRGVAVHHDGAIEGAGNNGFFVTAKIVAELCGIALLVQHGDRFFVADAREWRLHVFQLPSVALERFQFARFVFHDRLNDGADETFAERHDFVQLDVGGFRLEHPEFGEVAARF